MQHIKKYYMEKRKQVQKQKLSDILFKYSFDNVTSEQEELRVEKNLAEIDNKFEDLEEYVGRELTEDEKSNILDIVDEHTPKNKDGTFLTEILPFDYAWRIYVAKKDIELGEFLGGLEIDG